jgi:ribonuclease P protein component
MSLPVPNRLKKKKDFDEVFKKGKAVNGSFLFIKALFKTEGPARFGFIVAAKYAPRAVARNRIRRMLSAVIWPSRLPNMPPCDTVVVVTKKIPENITSLEEDFISVLRKARL